MSENHACSYAKQLFKADTVMYSHAGLEIFVESKVEHELNKAKRDEPAACTVANIS